MLGYLVDIVYPYHKTFPRIPCHTLRKLVEVTIVELVHLNKRGDELMWRLLNQMNRSTKSHLPKTKCEVTVVVGVEAEGKTILLDDKMMEIKVKPLNNTSGS